MDTRNLSINYQPQDNRKWTYTYAQGDLFICKNLI